MALVGAPLAHGDHAVRACYSALRMQEAVKRHSEEVRRTHGIEVQIRVGPGPGALPLRNAACHWRCQGGGVPVYSAQE